MGKRIKSLQNRETKSSSKSGLQEDRFGGIVPLNHAENRAGSRQKQGDGKNSWLTLPAGRSNGRWSWQKRSVFILTCLLFFSFVAIYFIVPAIVQGPLIRQAGQALGCQLTVGRFSFSPFTFGFRGENVELASQAGETTAGTWLKAVAVTGKLQLLPLLQGHIRVEDLLLDRPELFLFRNGSGWYNIPLSFSQIQHIIKGGRQLLEPDVFSFQIIDGTFFFDDQLTGNKHQVEHLRYTPDTKGLFLLQAVVDGSPVTIHRRDGKGSRDRRLFQLQLDDIELGRYLAYLPWVKDLQLSLSGRAKGTLEVQLLNEGTGNWFTVEGQLALKDVFFDGRKDGVELAVPAARFSFELVLPQGRLLVRELVLRQPDLVLASGLPALLMKIDSRLAKTTFRRLLIDQGRLAVQAGKQTFHFQDVQASLQEVSGSRNGNGSDPAVFQFGFRPAGDLHGELSMDGKIGRGELNGHLQVRGVDLADLSEILDGTLGLSGVKGSGDLDAEIVLKREGNDKKQQLYFRNSRLQLHDFQIQIRAGGEVSGKNLLCQAAEFLLDKSSNYPFCDRLDLEQAEIALPATVFIQPVRKGAENGLPFLFRDLELQDSIVHLTGEQQKEVVRLEQVRVQVHGLPGQVDNPAEIGLQASLGENGQFRLFGNMVQGKAQLEFGLHDVQLIDLPVLGSWFSLPIQEGRIRARGQLMLPEGQVVADVVLNDFLAMDQSRGALQWQQLAATGTRFRLHPLTLSVDDVVLDSPVLHFQPGSDGFLFPFSSNQHSWTKFQATATTKDESGKNQRVEEHVNVKSKENPWWRDAVVFKKITLTNGVFQSGRENVLPGLYPVLTGLYGTAEGWPTDPFSFSLNGRLDGSDLSFSGRVGDAGFYDFVQQVKDFSLAPFGEDFFLSHGLVADDARLSWKLVYSDNMDGTAYLDCVVKDLRPQSGSPLALTLAFLTDENDEIAVRIEQTEDDGRPLLLVQRIIKNLQAIRLKELVLPGATVRDQQPFLEFPALLQFEAGQSRGDELYLLDDYAELLRNRPHLRLVVKGSVDPNTDGVMLQQILQEEEDARREVENLRRQQERDRWIRQQQQAGSTLSPGHSRPGGQMHYPENLQTLPWHMVGVPVELLNNLAYKRAESVRQYLVMQQDIAPERIIVHESTDSGSAAAYLSLEPFYQSP